MVFKNQVPSIVSIQFVIFQEYLLYGNLVTVKIQRAHARLIEKLFSRQGRPFKCLLLLFKIQNENKWSNQKISQNWESRLKYSTEWLKSPLYIHTVPGSWICEHRQRHWLDQWKTWRKSDYRATRDRQRKNQVIRTKAQQSIQYQLPNTR